VTEDRAEDLKKTSTGDSGEPQPPAANQGKNEPFAAAPDDAPQSSAGGQSADGARDAAAAGSSSRAPGEQGMPPRAMEVDDARAAATMARAATMPATATGGVPTPGDSKGVSVPSVQAAAGTSEQSEQVEGVRITALAPPAKPDGEVDTRA
jgi:hypothetical protein